MASKANYAVYFAVVMLSGLLAGVIITSLRVQNGFARGAILAALLVLSGGIASRRLLK